MPFLAIIADDLTGAADSGAVFARNGFRTVVVVAGSAEELPPLDCDVVVIDIESRYLDPGRAAAEIRQAVAGARDLGARMFYKKVDSVLRGNVGAEVTATMEATGTTRCIFAPAFPAQGRITRKGKCIVHGVLLAQTEFAGSSNSPADGERATSDVAEILAATAGGSLPPGLEVYDAETDQQLRRLARQIITDESRPLSAGSAGLAGALAAVLAPGSSRRKPAAPPPRGSGVLVASGSVSGAAMEQLDYLLREHPGAVVVSVARSHGAPPVHGTLESGGLVVVKTESDVTVQDAALRIATTVRALLDQGPRPVLVIVGGDTAAHLLAALGCRSIITDGELIPGVARGRFGEGPFAGLPVITKAGAFGTVDTLVRITNLAHEGTDALS